MKKKLWLLAPLTLTLPVYTMVSCQKKPLEEYPKNDVIFNKVLENFKKISLQNLNIYSDINILNKNLERLQEYTPNDFYDKYFSASNLEEKLKKISLNDENRLFDGLSKNEKEIFLSKYKFVFLGVNHQNNLTLGIDCYLMRKDNSYLYKGKEYKNYFFYAKKSLTINGFKNEKQIIEQKTKNQRIYKIISITLPTLAIIAFVLYIVISIILKKKKGINYGK